MKRYASFLGAALCSMTLVSSASAHVRLVYPQGGETFAWGSRVTIEWQLLVPHSQQDWDVYFSSDGGVTWDTLALNLPISLRSYDWTVPEIETVHAKIKVVQDNLGVNYESTTSDFSIQAVTTAVSGTASLPAVARLFASYPNPFTSSTSIEFVLPHLEEASLEVFDVYGVKVATVVSGSLPAGRHHVKWQPSGLATGVYLIRFEVADRTQIMSVVLTK